MVHAQEQAPRESCGLVVTMNNTDTYWPCKNLVRDPCSQEFILDPADYALAADAGRVVGVVHSHLLMGPVPSQADLLGIERSDVPWWIVNPATGAWGGPYEPSGYRAPLLGRTWAWGVADCWGLVRDWYGEQGITLPDYERPPTPEEFESGPIFEKLWQSAGFFALPESAELMIGDVILMSIRCPVGLNHVGVYVGDQMLLHHLRGRLSGREIYGGWLLKCTGMQLRHPLLNPC